MRKHRMLPFHLRLTNQLLTWTIVVHNCLHLRFQVPNSKITTICAIYLGEKFDAATFDTSHGQSHALVSSLPVPLSVRRHFLSISSTVLFMNIFIPRSPPCSLMAFCALNNVAPLCLLQWTGPKSSWFQLQWYKALRLWLIAYCFSTLSNRLRIACCSWVILSLASCNFFTWCCAQERADTPLVIPACGGLRFWLLFRNTIRARFAAFEPSPRACIFVIIPPLFLLPAHTTYAVALRMCAKASNCIMLPPPYRGLPAVYAGTWVEYAGGGRGDVL